MSDPLLSKDDEMLAAEHALGLLAGDERAHAAVRDATQPAFALAAAGWTARFAVLAGLAAEPPPPGLWSRIEAAIAPAAGAAQVGTPMVSRRWRSTAVAALAVAAGLLAVVVARPLPSPEPTPAVAPAPVAPALAAILSGDRRAGTVTASLEPATRRLVTMPIGLRVRRGRAAQLWAIPRGGKPMALGLIDPRHPTGLTLSPRLVAAVLPGATLAISIEPAGGSPTGQPTGPVVVSGSAAAA